LTGDVGNKLTGRYREAKHIHDTAERIYGAKNITTIGHSQGAYQAQWLGDKFTK
jgi:pimeloyl-ACP methyl ester carboxylesterase